MRGLMLAAPASGSGKTVVTCGLLAALKGRGLDVRAFKCGPDYIDPMFHTRVLGVPSRSLDLFLQGEAGVRQTLSAHGGDWNLLESAMGFYDGVGGTDEASGWRTALAAGTPAVLVLRPKGASLTLAAQVKGLLDFRRDSRLTGLLLNDCTPGLHRHLAPLLERETGLPVLGWLPPMEEARMESRHLGLLTAAEVEDCSARFQVIAARMEDTVDVDGLLALAGGLSPPAARSPFPGPRCRIAVAADEAFCFYYQDNLDALRQAGAELVYFSPLRDEALPRGIGGLYLGGGYPELYGQALSRNQSMRDSVRRAVEAGMPTTAECGGFLYLQRTLADARGKVWPMAGALTGAGFSTPRLQRFGYVFLTSEEDSLLFRRGEQVPAHEFHYWDCTENGAGLTAQKPVTGAEWRCGVISPSLYAAFPHLHFGGRLPLARRFAEAAAEYGLEKGFGEKI